ncbi:BON domain-containing protein [Polaromonas sp. SM01]|uniref:BON domain-containing protein n=1 Tax=Polaromonas sp. SM01 TaxID=3085630 RepID=UPI0039904498
MKKTNPSTTRFKRLMLTACTMVVLGGSLTACFPLVLGGVAGGAMVATDRRTSGAQLEDEGIELRAMSRLRDNLGSRARVSVTSYNRQVLITGEVLNEQDKKLVEQVVSRVENVNGVVNELAIIDSPSLVQRSSDVLITGQVKALLIDTKDLYAGAFKVVTERGTVYLMGRVTQREADRATEIARGGRGVQKVVRIFEVISEEELKRLMPQQAAKPTAAVGTQSSGV